MYVFDPTPLQIVMAAVVALSAAFLAAWAVTGGEAPSSGDGGEPARGSAGGDGELEGLQKAIVWTAAGAALVFLVWWASLPGPSAGGPGF